MSSDKIGCAPVSGFETFSGLSLHTWVDKPDVKFNSDGVFKTKLVGDLAVPAVSAFKAKVDAAAQAALEEETKDLSVGQRKKWEVYLPYTLEEDEEGNETGRIIFEFKRNAKVTIRKTGEERVQSVAVYNSNNELLWPTPAVPDGATMRVVGTLRPIKIVTTGKAGVRMDFFAVKVLKMGSPPWPFSAAAELRSKAEIL